MMIVGLSDCTNFIKCSPKVSTGNAIFIAFVKVKTSPNDIGHIKVGYPVVVKVTSYDFSRHGPIEGLVRELSATTFTNEQGQSFYKGVISLSKSYVVQPLGEM